MVNGPNLNLLGTREPEIYGVETLADLEERVRKRSTELNLDLVAYHSNHEGEIIDFLHEQGPGAVGLIINPAAFTHYSYAIRDAIVAVGLRAVEVHISNIHEREPFRGRSVIAPVCVTQISGKGIGGYIEAINIIAQDEQGK